jgi:hypothetical protein
MSHFTSIKVEIKNRTKFIQSLQQQYAHKVLLKSIEENGFTLEEQEQLNDGTLHLLVGK